MLFKRKITKMENNTDINEKDLIKRVKELKKRDYIIEDNEVNINNSVEKDNQSLLWWMSKK
ncbi:MAG: hypothetical protein CMP55_00475 [Flavobacteriales bacterium]|nr:hypothetical protein [Flavobacteriales bacterium]|tara:strand:- start:810 stop:992 length:183 start_codon:yes stop_codon:yes gene_type:complete